MFYVNRGILRIGTRPSNLALKQVEEICSILSTQCPISVKFEIKTYDTTGDKDKITPISDVEGTDFFTDRIDKALLNGEIDFAVHSAKDLPGKLSDGLVVACITESIDPYDVLIVRPGLESLGSLDKLPYGAKIGTSSKRRKEQLKKYRHDFQIIDIRGNIEERLKLLDNNELRITNYELRNLDAIVIAAAGLIRLGLENKISQRIPFEILQPHPLQGCLAVVVRKDDKELIELFKKLDTNSSVYLI